MPVGTDRLACLTLFCVLVSAGGCTVPAEPDGPDWQSGAAQTLGDTSSDLATVELVLRQERAGRLPGRYGVVVALDSEERAGTTAQAFTSQQPPEGHRRQYDRVGSLLDDAGTLLAASRIALADNASEEYAGLIARLGRLGDRLERWQGRLE